MGLSFCTMEVQHLSGFEAPVTQNFLQIAAEESGTKGEKRKKLFRTLGPRARGGYGAHVVFYDGSEGPSVWHRPSTLLPTYQKLLLTWVTPHHRRELCCHQLCRHFPDETGNNKQCFTGKLEIFSILPVICLLWLPHPRPPQVACTCSLARATLEWYLLCRITSVIQEGNNYPIPRRVLETIQFVFCINSGCYCKILNHTVT